MKNKNILTSIISIIILIVLIVSLTLLDKKDNNNELENPSNQETKIETENNENIEPYELLENFIYINDKFYYKSDFIDLNSTSFLLGEKIGTIKYTTKTTKNTDDILNDIKNETAVYLEIGTTIHKIIGDETESMIGCEVGDSLVLYTLKDVELNNIVQKMIYNNLTFENIIELSKNKNNINWDTLINNYNLTFDNNEQHVFINTINGNFILYITGKKDNNENIKIYLKNIYDKKVYNIFDENIIINDIFGIDSTSIRNANFRVEKKKNNIYTLKLISDCDRMINGQSYTATFFEDDPILSDTKLKIGNIINISFVVRMTEEPIIYINEINIIE